MFTIIPCAAGCGKPAITGNNLCFTHLADPEQEMSRIYSFIKDNKIIKDLNVSGMRFENVDFSLHHFYGCNFREVAFSRCKFSEMKVRMSFFDFSNFIKCDLTKTDIQFVSFAGTNFKNCDFSWSDILHVNFEGSTIVDTSFDNSNLYNSRYISADISKTTFNNCNLKRVNFVNSSQSELIFKSSNTAEAIVDPDER